MEWIDFDEIIMCLINQGYSVNVHTGDATVLNESQLSPIDIGHYNPRIPLS